MAGSKKTSLRAGAPVEVGLRSAGDSTGEEISDGRLILVSNRLPVSVHTGTEGDVKVVPSAGGLATGLRGPHERGNGLWIGWPGDVGTVAAEARAAIDAQLAAMRAVPVPIPAGEMRRFYEGFSNGVLWPLLHHQLDRIPRHSRDWDAYARVNERFADVVAAHVTEDDRIWVHDYQLMLLPRLLRRRLPRARIGFFLHVPFPSSELFRALPWREPILDGLLGADLIGFHTFSYLRHFTTSLLRILGIESEIDHVEHEGRTVRLGVFPMGIDGAALAELAADPEVVAEAAAMRAAASGAKILLGVDRLDYTKGLLRRLLAVERLLEREPAWRGKLRFVQLTVPSRERVDEYRGFRRELEALVGRINGAHSTILGAPVHYLYQSVDQRRLVAMYRATDVMVVTPLRDGMNLVSKEFVATRTDGDGVLVLSEFAGAASELGEALIVNPYDVDGMAAALSRALSMPEAERRRRMTALHDRVLARSVHDWVASFVSTLDRTDPPRARAVRLSERPGSADAMAERLATAEDLVLLLDYDGTLVRLERVPELATPDAGVLDLLRALSALPRTYVNVISGRTRETLESWLGTLPVGLSAEHGLWWRPRPGAQWKKTINVIEEWTDRIRPILEEYAARTPGAVVEQKTASMTWHYRAADPMLGPLQAKELRLHLVEILAQQPVEIMTGDKVIEIRPHGMTKALAARGALEAAPPGALVVAFGDDRTDEDLFAALPEGSISIHVGDRATHATHRLAGPASARRLLERVASLRRAE